MEKFIKLLNEHNINLDEKLKEILDFKNQHKNTYQDWLDKFREVVDKRTKGKKCFTGLSSGYDSGVLTHLLTDLGVDFKAYSLPAQENKNIIDKRIKNIDKHEYLDFDFKKEKKEFVEKANDFKYWLPRGDGYNRQFMTEDDASIGGYYIAKVAKEQGYDTYVSTQGADEILSDYSPFRIQSEFKGDYPKDLEPWENMYWGCNYSYINKELETARCAGIDGVFPFLDLDLIQEFLWLSRELKNKYYKAPLYVYLTENNIPFEKGIKRGFNPK